MNFKSDILKDAPEEIMATYALAGLLFDLDQSNVCRDMQKIEPLVRRCVPIPQKMHKTAKRLRTPEEVENTFRVLLLSWIVQSSRFQDQKTKKEGSVFRQEEKAYRKDTAHGQQQGSHHS